MSTIGNAKTTLMTAAGIQAFRCSAKNDRIDRRMARRCPAAAATSTARVITGTNSRKHACPWMRNQPDSARIHRSCTRPAITEPAASRKTTYVGT